MASNPDRLARFAQEAKTTGALNHPNLLVIFDLGTHEGSPYLVTELLEGETLRRRLERGAVPMRKAIDWATQIAEGVAAAHEKGIIHRDIKLENIFLSRDERVKLLDFGLAKLLADEIEGEALLDDNVDTRMRHTQPGTVLGTPGYMAPEQVRAEPVDERADIFATGIVLTEMITGANPFHRSTRVETMTAMLQSDVVLPDSTSPGLVRIIDHMLAKDAGSRFQSMKDVAFALRLLSGSHASGEVSSSTQRLSVGAPERVERDFLSITMRRGRIGHARFTPDGRIVYGASWEGNPIEIFLATLSISPAGELAVSLGRRFLGGWVSLSTLARMRSAVGTDDLLTIYPVSGGDAVPLPGAQRGEWPICWSNDAAYVYVYPRGKTSLSIDRIDITTGEREVWQEINPVDGAGIVDIFPVWLTADGERHAYSYRRCLSDLYLVTSRALTR